MPTPSLQKKNKHLLVTDHDQPPLGVHLVHQQLVLNEQLVKYSQDLQG